MRLRLILAILATLTWTPASWAVVPVQEFSEAQLAAGREIRLKIEPPAGFKINENAPNRILLIEADSGRILRVWQTPTIRNLTLSVGRRPVSSQSWVLQGNLYLCQKQDSGVCLTLKTRQRFQVRSGVKSSTLVWTLQSPSTGAPSMR